MTTAQKTIEELANREYKYGFVTDVDADTVPPGLNEDVIRLISAKKQEPAWLLAWRRVVRRAREEMSRRLARLTIRSTTQRLRNTTEKNTAARAVPPCLVKKA